MIIGITGRIAAGKGKIVEILELKGFKYTTISNLIREEALKRKIPLERRFLQDLGNEVRKREGTNAWIKRLISRLKESENYIVDGIRNPGEIEELRKQRDFFLISIDAPQELRFERLISRAKPSDPKTWKEFLEIDNRDFGIGEPEDGQQVGKCMALSDFQVTNDSTLDELNKRIINLLEGINLCY